MGKGRVSGAAEVGRPEKNFGICLTNSTHIMYNTCMAKMGRPPKPENKKKNARIDLRVTKTELRKLRAEARKRGISLTELLLRPWIKRSK
jgi:predicted HicB family RNase H-like nuclease